MNLTNEQIRILRVLIQRPEFPQPRLKLNELMMARGLVTLGLVAHTKERDWHVTKDGEQIIIDLPWSILRTDPEVPL